MRIALLELRYAFRALRQRPGFSAVAVLTLGMGIAGTATLFSLTNGLLLKPLPVAEPERLAALYTQDYSGTRFGASSGPDLVSFREGLPAFDHVAGLRPLPIGLETGALSSRALVGLASADFFRGFGIPLALGRGFTVAEDAAGGDHAVVVLSHALWAARFDGAGDVLGQVIHLGGLPFTVIGVAAQGFPGLVRGIALDAYVPLAAAPLLNPGDDLLTDRSDRSLFVYGHLARGATLMQARAQVGALAERLYQAEPSAWGTLDGGPRAITILSEAEARLPLPEARGQAMLAALLLLLVTGAVLLIACANVASLSLAHALARRREVAVRLALGASRRRIAGQFFAEGLLLSAAGGGLALLLTLWLTDLAQRVSLPLPVPVALDLTPDPRVLGFVAAVTLLTGILLGLAPALQATRPGLISALKDGAGGVRAGRLRLRSALVVLQAALSLPLLVAAALFLRSMGRVAEVDPGFGARDGLVVTTDLGLIPHDPAQVHAFERDLEERARALPGVTAAGLTATLPFAVGANRSTVTPEGYQARPGEVMAVRRVAVGPGYFAALQLPVVQGRGFTPSDDADAARVVVVNAPFAERYWPGQNPLGRRVSFQGDRGPWYQVVGVTGRERYGAPTGPVEPCFFVPLQQVNAQRTTLLLRTTVDPERLIAPVRGLIRSLDPGLPVEGVGHLREELGLVLLPQRIAGLALSGFGLLGLLLSSLGVYGVVAYGVSQRRREIGIRVALGAHARSVVALMVGDGMRLIALGSVIGLLLAVPAGLVARRFLYGLALVDPAAFLGAPLLFVSVALLAGWLPARRAARVDPIVVMRTE
jgi:putative ABC transport system permease protein